MRTYTVQVTEIFAVHCSEDKVAVFLTVRDETEWSEPAGELLEWDDTIWWIGSDDLVRTVSADYRSMWLTLHQVNDLSISIEDH